MLLALALSIAGAAERCETLRLQPRPAVLTGYVCREVSEGLALCAACDGRIVRTAELTGWQTTEEAVFAALVGQAAERLTLTPPEKHTIADMPGQSYWLSQHTDGFDAAGLLHPERLSELAGTTPVIGIPAVGTFLMWIPGDEETDRVMAVGIRRIYESAAHPVSGSIYRWHSGEWAVWGAAVPGEE